MKIELGIGIRDLGIEIDIGIEACFGAKSHLFGVCGHSMALSLQGRVVFRSIHAATSSGSTCSGITFTQATAA